MKPSAADPAPAPARPGSTLHPLGPWVYRVAARHPLKTRLLALALLAGSSTLLILAARVTPDPSGLGTHRQLGLPACSVVVLTGYPCPTCGMTTAFAYTVRGRLIAAFLAQPAGTLLAMATIAAVGISLGVLVTGKVWRINWYRVPPGRVSVLVLAILLGGWIFKLVRGIRAGIYPVWR